MDVTIAGVLFNPYSELAKGNIDNCASRELKLAVRLPSGGITTVDRRVYKVGWREPTQTVPQGHVVTTWIPKDNSHCSGEVPMRTRANAPNAEVGVVTCGLAQHGCVLHDGPASLYKSSKTKAVYVKGKIRDRFGASGWERGPNGYPTSQEFCGLRDRGCGQRYQDGNIYWSAATGAWSVHGAIAKKYGSMGWERSSFGYPRTNEFCGLRNGGCGQHFQHRNGSIYWSPATGAQPIEGKIKDHWARMGWERSKLGFPTSGEYRKDGLVMQNFQGGWLAWNGKSVYGEGWSDPRSQKAPDQYGSAAPEQRTHSRELVEH